MTFAKDLFKRAGEWTLDQVLCRMFTRECAVSFFGGWCARTSVFDLKATFKEKYRRYQLFNRLLLKTFLCRSTRWREPGGPRWSWIVPCGLRWVQWWESTSRMICCCRLLSATLRPGRGSLHGLLPALRGVSSYSITHPRSTAPCHTTPFQQQHNLPWPTSTFHAQQCSVCSMLHSIPNLTPPPPLDFHVNISMSIYVSSTTLFKAQLKLGCLARLPLSAIVREKYWKWIWFVFQCHALQHCCSGYWGCGRFNWSLSCGN